MTAARGEKSADHKALALWAAACAERVQPFFEQGNIGDDRPRRAIEAARAWAIGHVSVAEARMAALTAHAAARGTGDPVARAAARAAGHAAATAHVITHAPHVAAYALRCFAPDEAAEERAWQLQQLPENLRHVVPSANVDV